VPICVSSLVAGGISAHVSLSAPPMIHVTKPERPDKHIPLNLSEQFPSLDPLMQLNALDADT
jgi:hypothetical protein